MEIRIGITTSFAEQEQRLSYRYVRAVEQAGGIPLIVPILAQEDTVRAVADMLDGLLIPGGPAIIDGLIGRLPEDLSETDPLRLSSDRRIFETIRDAGKPILGICYGMQLMNALAGGTIYADVERQVAGARTHSQKRGATSHPIRLADGSTLRNLLKTDEIDVNTRHIQAVATVGADYRITATAPDGVVEAIENEDGTHLGVQFHPEQMETTMGPLFQHLIACARNQQHAHSVLHHSTA